MAVEEKPYVYQHSPMHRELQAMLDREFHMIQPADLEKYREKIEAVFCFVSPPVNADLIASLPKLRVIGNSAVGYDHIDLEACAAREVRVSNTPDVASAATADMAWALLLAAARRVLEGDCRSKSLKTTCFDMNWLGFQVSGTTLGIIGMGRIGLEVAKRAQGFNMRVLYHNRKQRPKDVEEKVKATYVPSLSDLLEQSDYVVLAAPASKETHRMMSREQFKAMKQTGIFVNISRGSLVDQDALVQALRGEDIAAAGLDVTDPEPLPRSHALLTLPNVTITPHTGNAILQTRTKMVQMTIDDIRAGIDRKSMPNEILL